MVRGCLGAGALVLFSVSISAQQTEEQTTNSTETGVTVEASTQLQTPNSTPVGRKELYYLGERPKLQRQLGPSVGKPRNILPQPFVPKESIIVPPAPVVAATAAESDGEKKLGEEGSGQTVSLATETTAEDVTQSANTQDPTTLTTPLLVEGQFLEAGTLDLLDPSGRAVLKREKGYPLNFWEGYSRGDIIAGYGAFAGAAGSRALARIARKIALSGVAIPKPEAGADTVAVLEARLDLLASLGDSESYIALLEQLPAERDWSALAKYFTNKHLLKGELNEACAVAAEERAEDDDPYWLRLAAFCEAARGNRTGVDFQLGILEEVTSVRPTFYQLIDQIVVEAVQARGTVLAEAVALSNSLQVELLEATMARLARAKVPLLALDGVNPLAVQMMLSLPGVERAAKVDLMGFAVRRGWVTDESLTAFAANHHLEDGEQEAALAALVDDGRFIIDAALLNLSGPSSNVEMRALALQKLWDRSIRHRTTSIAASGYLGVMGDIVANPDMGIVGPILARTALIGGNLSQATLWYRAFRAEGFGSNETDHELVALTPLFNVAGMKDAPQISLPELRLWWQGEAAKEGRFERANLLFTILEALGNHVPPECWSWLEEGPAVFDGGVPSAALWRSYLVAVQAKDIPKALSRAFALTTEIGPARVPAALAGSLVAGLIELGLEEEARLIAVEMLISQGV